MNTASTTSELPLWETAHNFYQTVREQEGEGSPSLVAQLQALMSQMMEELRQPTRGIITQAARDQFRLTVSNRNAFAGSKPDFLAPGDVRLISSQCLQNNDQPVAVLLLDQDFKTDEWTVIPFSQADAPLREGEWQTDLDEPHVRVLCFWNAHKVQGCVLEDSENIGSFSKAELDAAAALRYAWVGRREWSAADLARSGDQWSASPAERSDHEESQRDIARSLTSIRAFHPPAASRASRLLASNSASFSSGSQTYLLPGFGRKLSLSSAPGGLVDVVLSASEAQHVAELEAPVLMTRSGNIFNLKEDEVIKVPLSELLRGFWISLGEFGWAPLVEAQA